MQPITNANGVNLMLLVLTMDLAQTNATLVMDNAQSVELEMTV